MQVEEPEGLGQLEAGVDGPGQRVAVQREGLQPGGSASQQARRQSGEGRDALGGLHVSSAHPQGDLGAPVGTCSKNYDRLPARLELRRQLPAGDGVQRSADGVAAHLHVLELRGHAPLRRQRACEAPAAGAGQWISKPVVPEPPSLARPSFTPATSPCARHPPQHMRSSRPRAVRALPSLCAPPHLPPSPARAAPSDHTCNAARLNRTTHHPPSRHPATPCASPTSFFPRPSPNRAARPPRITHRPACSPPAPATQAARAGWPGWAPGPPAPSHSAPCGEVGAAGAEL